MAKQSMKQQIYQSIANSQVQQVMAQKREQEIAQLQASFDAWNKQQDEIANLQAQYDSWLKEQPQAQPIQQIAQPQSGYVRPTTGVPDRNGRVSKHQIDYANMPGNQFDKKKAEEAIAKKELERDIKKNNKLGDIAGEISENIIPKLGESRKSKDKGTEKWDKSVNEVVKALNSKEMKQANALADYNKNVAEKAKVDQWLSPDYKLSDKDKEDAKKYAQAELKKYDYNSGKKPVLKSAEDRQHYADMVNLLNKTNPFTNAMAGVIKQPAALGRAVRDAGNSIIDQLTGLGAAVGDKAGITEGATQRHNEKVAAREAFNKQNDESMIRALEGAKTQNPGATTAGEIGGQIGMYALTNPLFDSLGAAAGLGKAGSFAVNQLGQNAQDLALDTIPMLNNYLEGGVSDAERKELLKNVGINAAGNLVMGAAGEGISALAKNQAAKKAANEAFRANALEGADKLAKLANLEDVDNVVRNATRQADEAAQNIETLAKQIPELPSEATKEAVKELPGEVQDKLLSDFEEIYRSMDNMNQAAIDSGDAKVLEKFGKLQDAVFNYEETIWKSGNPEEVNKAKKAADAARQGFIRQMQKIDPTYKGDLTGTKLGNAEYRLPQTISDAEAEEMVNGWVKEEMENPNRFVEDVSKRNQVMAEDTGLKAPEPESDTLTFDYEKPVGDSPSEPLTIGEEILTPDNYKERGTSKHIRNAGTPMKMEDVAEEVAADFEKDPDMYRVLRNADTKAKAEEIYNTSDDPESAFRALLERKDPASLPLGHQIAKDYAAAGNHDAAAQIYRDMGKALTESGQFSQAAVINMVKNDPMTALQFAEKEIDFLNEAGVKRFGDNWKDFKLTDDEIKAFDNIKAGDADAIKEVYKNIGDRLGKEYPTTLWDKLIEARRVAMLFNPRTNVRNVLANPPTLGMRWLSDRAEALGQNVAHLINPDIKVTQSLYGSGIKGRQLATEVYNSPRVQALLEGSGSKADLPNLKNSLMENKQVFKGTAVEKWIDKVTDGGIQKANEKLFGKKGVQSVPETIRNATYKLLDLGDRPFVKENFVERLGSYIAATGTKNIDDIPDEAIELAWEEAMKATYKDNSWAVDMIRGFKKGMEKADNFVPGFGTALSQSTIPFVQAPGNIAARMVDYSPAGAARGIADIISGARKSNVKSVEKGIEEAAKGLTGTGLIYLGMKLKESGLLTGTYSSDKKKKAFEKMNGFKEYALHIGDKYFTYGWAQPFAQELMVGTLLQDAIDKSDEYDSDILRYYGYEDSVPGKAIGVAREGTKAAINSWFNESPLSGLADLLKGNSYENTDIAGNLWDNGVSDFAGALIPSVVNATAKVADTTQRNTYNPDNAYASFINANVAKIPGLSKTLPAKYDTWGREMKYAENAGAAAAARYAIPGEYSYDKGDEVDKEIQRLFDEAKGSDGKLLQDNGVFPTVAPNKVGEKTLSNKEVSEYQKDMGQRSRTAVESFINSDIYKSMEDPEKVETLKKIYGASNAITKRDKFDSPLADNSEYKKAVAAYDEAGGGEAGAKAIAEYYTNKNTADQSGLSSSSKAYEEIQKDLAKGDTEAANEKIEAAKTIQDYGLTKPGPSYTYYNAQEKIPSLTPEEFSKTYKAIDSNGNQGITQDELINYLNKSKISEAEGKKLWSAYGSSNWKAIPKLENGTWKKGK